MSARRVLEPLSKAECMQLLANGGLGRLVYNSRYGPTALPAGREAVPGMQPRHRRRCHEVRTLVHAADPEVTETVKRSTRRSCP
jgi:hypothetical protein